MAKWSTKVIDDLLAQVDKTGVMPKDNPFHMGNIEWRKPNLQFSYTKEELLEMAKCQLNILHFAETHCEVMTDEGHRKVRMRDYQKRVLLQYKKYRFNCFLASRQIGKQITTTSQINIETIIGDKIYNLRIPLFELYYEIKKRNIGKLRLLDKIKRSLYRQLCRIEGIHQYLHTEEWDKFTSYQNTGR